MYNHILVPTDGSDVVAAAADHAIELAAHFDATVHALYAIEPENTTLPSEAMRHKEMYDDYVTWGEEITNDIVDRASDSGVKGVGVVESGTPHEVISDYAMENDIDVIVMGTAGRSGWRERLLGSVTERTLRTSQIPVLTVQADETE